MYKITYHTIEMQKNASVRPNKKLRKIMNDWVNSKNSGTNKRDKTQIFEPIDKNL